MIITATKAVAAVLIAGALSPGTEAAYEKKAAMEETRVACMKEQGLTYLAEPVVKRQWQPGERERLAGDYEALRAYRAKYGFGVWSKHVFPDAASKENPNNKNMMAMSAKELKKWRAADEGCFAKAAKEHLGMTVTSFWDDYLTKLDTALEDSIAPLDKDPRLVGLGERFAKCLGAGPTKPSVLAELGRSKFLKERTELAKKNHKGDKPVMWGPMKPAEARPYLAKEIKAALKDLECGKTFYAAYSPAAWAAKERVYQEFAMTPML
ncbi:hypothetical protein SAMN05444920_12946 [Nonomuraea solani]|uniref:Uncharacterized protein n=1 Tax=Nonomuraea solani TaxID=1144553 RepID=A0A1H6EXU0_9ACTN|nr:hypothetical protein [Nonomuraea solani]SEH02710.1 hypothetical protein SAMN05444920_12946 [Nonomuraea solani]